MKAKSEVVKAERKLEQAKEDYIAKKEDNAQVLEAKLAAQGKIHSTVGSSRKPDHVIEGENAIKYMKYVNQSADAYRVYHRTPVDPREWRAPIKDKEESEYDIKEDDDPLIYNNKKPWNKKKRASSSSKKSSSSATNKMTKASTFVKPQMKSDATPPPAQ